MQQPVNKPLFSETTIATFMVVLAGIMFGSVPFFAKALTQTGLAPPAVAFYRYLLVGVLLAPFLDLRRSNRVATLWGLGAGIVMGLGWIGFVEALKSLPVATAGVLYMSYPLFTLLIGRLLFGVGVGPRAMLAGGMVLLGAMIGANGNGGAHGYDMTAIALALSAAASFALGINILIYRLSTIPTLARVPCVSLGALLGLAPLIISLPIDQVLPNGVEDIGFIIAIGVVTALIPQVIYVNFAPAIGISRTAVAGSVELPTMMCVGWLIFGEPASVNQAVGAILILTALVISPTAPSSTRLPKR